MREILVGESEENTKGGGREDDTSAGDGLLAEEAAMADLRWRWHQKREEMKFPSCVCVRFYCGFVGLGMFCLDFVGQHC